MKSESDEASKNIAAVQRLEIQANYTFLNPLGINLCTYGCALIYLDIKIALLEFPTITAIKVQIVNISMLLS